MPHGAPHPDDLTRIAAVLERMTQQLDRTDATLERWLAEHSNGR